MLEDFTCCMGTGMENHALHGEGIYYESHDTVWVNLFAPSTADLDNGARLTTATDFPAVAGVTLVLGALYVVINTLVDLAQVAADPRLRTA